MGKVTVSPFLHTSPEMRNFIIIALKSHFYNQSSMEKETESHDHLPESHQKSKMGPRTKG